MKKKTIIVVAITIVAVICIGVFLAACVRVSNNMLGRFIASDLLKYDNDYYLPYSSGADSHVVKFTQKSLEIGKYAAVSDTAAREFCEERKNLYNEYALANPQDMGSEVDNGKGAIVTTYPKMEKINAYIDEKMNFAENAFANHNDTKKAMTMLNGNTLELSEVAGSDGKLFYIPAENALDVRFYVLADSVNQQVADSSWDDICKMCEKMDEVVEFKLPWS